MSLWFQWREVPPPEHVPVVNPAESDGLPNFIMAKKSRCPYRCQGCGVYGKHDGKLVYLPDSVMSGDSAELVREQLRMNAYNGSRTGWCVPCVQRLIRVRVSIFQRIVRYFSTKENASSV